MGKDGDEVIECVALAVGAQMGRKLPIAQSWLDGILWDMGRGVPCDKLPLKVDACA